MTTPSLQQLAEAAATEFDNDRTWSKSHLIAIILKHLAPLEAQLVEAKDWADKCEASQAAWQEKHAQEMEAHDKTKQDLDEARREVERLTKYNKAIINFDLTTENQQLKARAVELEDEFHNLAVYCEGDICYNHQDISFILKQCKKVLASSPSASLTHYQELERMAKALEWLEKNKADIKPGSNGLSKESGKYRYGFLVFTVKTQWVFGETLLEAIEAAMKK